MRRRLQDLPSIKQSRLNEIKAIKDEDIDYSDIPELTDGFWDKA